MVIWPIQIKANFNNNNNKCHGIGLISLKLNYKLTQLNSELKAKKRLKARQKLNEHTHSMGQRAANKKRYSLNDLK